MVKIHKTKNISCRGAIHCQIVDPLIKTIQGVLSTYLGDEVQQSICCDSVVSCTYFGLYSIKPKFLSKFKSVIKGLWYALASGL